jgi:Arc/MetJ-type ribon-helix-helix transcriptional regulator
VRESVVVIRTQIRLTESQVDALRAMARADGRSMAEVVRVLVEELLAGGRRQRTEERRRALSAIGRLGKRGPRDLSRRHDDYLAEAYR